MSHGNEINLVGTRTSSTIVEVVAADVSTWAAVLLAAGRGAVGIEHQGETGRAPDVHRGVQPPL